MTEEAAATQGTESSVREERKIHSRRSVTLPRRWEYFSDPKLTSSAQNAVHEVRLKMCSIRTRGKVGVPYPPPCCISIKWRPPRPSEERWSNLLFIQRETSGNLKISFNACPGFRVQSASNLFSVLLCRRRLFRIPFDISISGKK